MKTYSAANNGKEPTGPEQILLYITTPEEQAALQRFFKKTKEAQAFAAK